MAVWMEPEWLRGQCRLPQDDWDNWRDRYAKGDPVPCMLCGHRESVVLRPIQHIVNYGCGHVMELPERTDL